MAPAGGVRRRRWSKRSRQTWFIISCSPRVSTYSSALLLSLFITDTWSSHYTVTLSHILSLCFHWASFGLSNSVVTTYQMQLHFSSSSSTGRSEPSMCCYSWQRVHLSCSSPIHASRIAIMNSGLWRGNEVQQNPVTNYRSLRYEPRRSCDMIMLMMEKHGLPIQEMCFTSVQMMRTRDGLGPTYNGLFKLALRWTVAISNHWVVSETKFND